MGICDYLFITFRCITSIDIGNHWVFNKTTLITLQHTKNNLFCYFRKAVSFLVGRDRIHSQGNITIVMLTKKKKKYVLTVHSTRYNLNLFQLLRICVSEMGIEIALWIFGFDVIDILMMTKTKWKFCINKRFVAFLSLLLLLGFKDNSKLILMTL